MLQMRLNIGKSPGDKLFFLALIFILCAAYQSASAQFSEDININWGEEYKAPNKSRFIKILGSDESYFYTLRIKYGVSAAQNELFVERFNINTSKLVDVSMLNLKYQKKLRVFHDILKVKDQFYLITSYHNRGQKKNYLFAQAFNSKMKVSDKLIKIGEIDVKNMDREGDFDVKLSRDSSKILVYHDLPGKKSDNEKLALTVYDQEFEELWSKNVNLPYDNKSFALEEYKVDNLGNVYLLGVRFYDGNKLRRKGKPNYEYTLISYSNNGENRFDYNFRDADKFFTDLTCLLYTSPSPRDATLSRMPSSA